MEPESNKAISDRYLRTSADCLSVGNLTGCRKYALQALDSDPQNSGADQILAVADVLLSAERCYPNNHHDWYSILKVRRSDSDNEQLVWSQFQKLVALVNPSRNRFAFAKEAFNLVCEAYEVLSDPGMRTQYENAIGGEREPQQRSDAGRSADGGERSFWTACPYCYYIYEYDKVYEDCCLRCQNCRKSFHGVATDAPPAEIMVPGKEQYYFCYGLFQVKHNRVSVEKKGKKEATDKNGAVGVSDQAVIEILDDEEEEEGSGNGDVGAGVSVKKNEEDKMGNRNGFEKKEQGSGGVRSNGRKRMSKAPARRMMNMKAVATNTNKVVGNRIRDWDLNENRVDGFGLAFYEGEEDVFVGLEDIEEKVIA